jgi:hypothetical protein
MLGLADSDRDSATDDDDDDADADADAADDADDDAELDASERPAGRAWPLADPFAAEIAILRGAAERVAARARGEPGSCAHATPSQARAAVSGRVLVRECVLRPLAVQAKILDAAAVALLVDVRGAPRRCAQR